MRVATLPPRLMHCHYARRLLVLAWGALTACGLLVLIRYETKPAGIANATASWPVGSKLAHDQHGPTLILFAHPHCPCTRATLAELERLVAQSAGKVQPQIVFLSPSGEDADWKKTDLWRAAQAIPGVRVVSDVDGAEAKQFHVSTSGHVLLYDAGGKLLFSGGITSARGHEGDNAGRDALVSLLNRGTTDRRQTPVFGCPIFNPVNP